jgi:hypothetical protein
MKREYVCFSCLDGDHLNCNGNVVRCDCWECLEQEMYDDSYLDEPNEGEDE